MIDQYLDGIFGLTITLFGIVLLVCSAIRYVQFKGAMRQEKHRQDNNQDFIGYVPIYAAYYPDGMFTVGGVLLIIGSLLISFAVGIWS